MMKSLSLTARIFLSSLFLSSLLFSNLLISKTVHANEDIISLEPEEVLTETVESNTWQYYLVELDEPANLTVKLRKVKGNADVYVVSTRKPTHTFNECAPKKPDNKAETCRIKSDTASIWYVGVYGKKTSTYDLKVESKGFTGSPSKSHYEIGSR